MIVALTLRQWTSLVRATGLGDAFATLEETLNLDFSREGDRFEAREVLGAVIKPWTVRRTLAEISAAFDGHDVCWGPYQTFMELVDQDPRCSTDNPLFEEVEQPGIGTYLMAGSPLELSAFERLAVRPAPELGQHTEEVLADVLGLGEAEIGRLHDDGVVAGPVAAGA
jgi:2-methylfumaryl-CoA isomerase